MRWPTPALMARLAPFLAVALAGCGHTDDASLSAAPPGLRVAEAALDGGAAPVALAMLDSIVEREPRNAAALVRQGDANTALGRTTAATESYRRALAVDPGRVDARFGLGRLLLATDPAGAEALLAAVVAVEPRHAAALNDLGIAQDRQDRHAEAQANYRAAVAADPRMTAAMTNLGLSLALSGRAAEAVATLQPLAADPGAPARVRHDYAVALALAGRRPEAERVLGRDLPPKDAKDVLDGLDALAPGRD